MNYSLFFLAGLIVSLGFPPAGLWPLSFFAFVWMGREILSQVDSLKAKHSALALFTYAWSVNIFGFYWIAYTFHDFANMSWWVAVPLMFLLLGLLSLLTLVWGAFLALVKKIPGPKWLWVGLLLALWDGFDFRFFPWSPVMSVGENTTLLASVHFLGTWGWRLL